MQAVDQQRDHRFHQLLTDALKYDADERRAFLDAACADDHDLLEDVLQAASVDRDALGDFLESPVVMRLPGGAKEPDRLSESQRAATRIDRATHRSNSESRDLSTKAPTSVLSRLKATPGVSLFAGLVLAFPILLGAAAIGTATFLNAVHVEITPGALSGRVTQVSEARWPEVGLGDEIVAVRGVPVGGDPARIRAAFLELEPGPVTLRLRRGAEEYLATASLSHRAPAQKAVVWTRVVTGALLFTIGAVAFVLRPGTAVAWIFLSFCSALSLHLLAFMALVRRPPEGIVLEGAGMYLTAACGLHLFTTFPQRLLRRRWWAVVFYLPAVAAMLVMFPLYRVSSAVPAVTRVLLWSAPFAATASLASVALVLFQHRKARKAGDEITQARTRALFAAVALGLAVPAMLAVLPVFHRLEIRWAANSFLVVVFVLIMAYSMVRHNTMEVDRFTAAVLGYSVTSLVLGSVFAAAVVGLPAWIGSSELFRSPAAVAALTAAFFGVFHPLYRRVAKRVDRLFQREPVEDDTALRLLRHLADSVRTADLSRSFRAGLETAMSLHGERAEIWTRTPDGTSLMRTCSGAGDQERDRENDTATGPPTARLPLSMGGPLARALTEKSGGVAGLADQVLDPDAQEELWSRDLALAAPVFAHDQLQGFVGVARKRNGARYSRRERSFLDAVASQMGIAMEHGWELAERVGPYRILERLGTGGMAEVLLAEKHGPGGFERLVAMKRMLPHLAENDSCVAMFLDEARIAAQLHHPHIVQIYDIEEHDETYYLAMELMDGPSLSKLLRRASKRGEKLPLPVAVAIGAAVLNALGYAHRKTDRRGRSLGLVHRDVKPGNILLSRQGEIKLSDFGIAHAEFRLYQTQPGLARGTPAYMSPEQQDGHDVGPRADLFGAGAVIYESITGEQAIRVGPDHRGPAPPATLDPDLPPPLLAFMGRALSTRQEDRFATAEEMRDAFLASVAPVLPAAAEAVAEVVVSLMPVKKRPKVAKKRLGHS